MPLLKDLVNGININNFCCTRIMNQDQAGRNVCNNNVIHRNRFGQVRICVTLSQSDMLCRDSVADHLFRRKAWWWYLPLLPSFFHSSFLSNREKTEPHANQDWFHVFSKADDQHRILGYMDKITSVKLRVWKFVLLSLITISLELIKWGGGPILPWYAKQPHHFKYMRCKTCIIVSRRLSNICCRLFSVI